MINETATSWLSCLIFVMHIIILNSVIVSNIKGLLHPLLWHMLRLRLIFVRRLFGDVFPELSALSFGHATFDRSFIENLWYL